MLERFKDNIIVDQKTEATEEEKEKKRVKAIDQHISTNLFVPKERFIDYMKEKSTDQSQKIAQKIEYIDFSKANPRNNTFMNELAFAGAGMTEGFLEVFNIEKNTAISKYQDHIQIIEIKNKNKPSQFFAGTFQNGKLRRLSPNTENKEELESKLNASLDRQRKEQEERLNKKKTNNQTIQLTNSLDRQKEN